MAEQKDGWDKLEIVAKFLGATLVPAVIVLSAYLINNEMSKRQTRNEVDRLALEILSSPVPNFSDPEQVPLRRWAINALSQGFDFSEAEQQLLLSGEVNLPKQNRSTSGLDVSPIYTPVTGAMLDEQCTRKFPDLPKEECYNAILKRAF